MEHFTIARIKGDTKEVVKDLIAEEIPFTIMVNDKELVTLLCSPLDLEDLVRGFLFSSGLINNVKDLKKIIIDRQQWIAHVNIVGKKDERLVFKRLYTSGCGKGTIFYNANDIAHRKRIVSDFKIKNKKLNKLMVDFQARAHSYVKTGGVHSAAIADKEKILVFREDIGRHSAIDKAIGQTLLNSADFHNKVLATTGRVSSEVLLKARKCAIPIVISKSAPTNQAVKLSRSMGITLIGFARGSRMNIYSSEERIIFDR